MDCRSIRIGFHLKNHFYTKKIIQFIPNCLPLCEIPCVCSPSIAATICTELEKTTSTLSYCIVLRDREMVALGEFVLSIPCYHFGRLSVGLCTSISVGGKWICTLYQPPESLFFIRLYFLQCCYLSLPISFLLLYLTFVFNAFDATLLSGLYTFSMRCVSPFSRMALYVLHRPNPLHLQFIRICGKVRRRQLRVGVWNTLWCNTRRQNENCVQQNYVRAKHNSTFIEIRWAYDMCTYCTLARWHTGLHTGHVETRRKFQRRK